MAAAGDGAQGVPYVRERHGAGGRVPGAGVRLLAGAAVRVGQEHQPHIWERIKKAVADGNWAPVGSMWVESDANMPGGEALARQIVHGKRFFTEELGWRPTRSGCRTPSATPPRSRSWRSWRGALVPHPEAVVEPGQQDAAPLLLLGGHRRLAGLHPLPARGHLQLAVPRA
ncbi:hypothetical protein NKH77_39890 [Streptomyces sp. M19]